MTRVNGLTTPDPPTSADERTTLLAVLDWHRVALLRKVDGLDREALTRRLVPSETTLLGLVKHLAYVERWWFRRVFAGEEVAVLMTPEDVAADFRVNEDETVAAIMTLYHDEVARARAIVDTAQLDDRARREGWTDRSLRWILAHMIEERARHCGHADILRELTDGSVGE